MGVWYPGTIQAYRRPYSTFYAGGDEDAKRQMAIMPEPRQSDYNLLGKRSLQAKSQEDVQRARRRGVRVRAGCVARWELCDERRYGRPPMVLGLEVGLGLP